MTQHTKHCVLVIKTITQHDTTQNILCFGDVQKYMSN